MIKQTSFYFLRHGETEWNRLRRCQGRSDIPLNETGVAQAHAAKERMRGLEIGTICVSPLIRARQTAEIVNEVLQRPIVVIDDLQEISFGPYEGTEPGPWYTDLLKGVAHEGVESIEAFFARALTGLNKALEHEGPVLVVAHGGVFWSVQHHAALGPRNVIPNAVPLRLDHGPDGWISELMEAVEAA